ncbi:MAG: prepilin-type N-terminal cleavage/methylation domain-containing protein [Acidobacteria bacterium]|uniref:Prepilin-type N-terminal cleavage/methylation domain-containing protein n=1 Tax=Candidatus Polarisedimenticola svalbardensis TaxID=2886004 RepID=A0A8J6Y0L4_9BACT|nr:prepilin-type N-terminal cleavage/methylation domain-containing protein [Candidatus Polarisedimenticola svalbardensis]
MTMQQQSRQRREGGYSLIEILIVLVIISLIAAIAIPIYSSAITKSRRSALVADLRVLHDSMKRYYLDKSRFPLMGGGDPLETMSLPDLAPLSTGGYFSSVDGLNQKLLFDRVLGYTAYNDDGTATEFAAIMRPKKEPAVIVWLLYTDNVGPGGTFRDGIYFFENGVWMSADEAL